MTHNIIYFKIVLKNQVNENINLNHKLVSIWNETFDFTNFDSKLT